jgi:HTH-type transcriptional regulator / antitoxin HigA
MTVGGGTMSANPSINQQRYGKLLAKTLPGVIEAEEEYQRLLHEAEKLFDKGEDSLAPEEQALLELLVHLVQDYEERHYHIKAADPRTVLLELMELRKVKPRDLWRIFGSKGVTSEVLSGRRDISKAKAKALAEYFHVSVELFI